MRKKLVSLLAALTLLGALSVPAFADEADMAKVDGGLEITQEYADEVNAMRGGGIFDDEELNRMVEDFIAEHKLKKENFSIGFVYTATGDTWYYNPDTWYYPGSMYKIPLMMLVAEQVSSGMLDQEDMLYGMSVSQIEEYILTYSNNDWAHRMRTYLEGDEVWRGAAKAYANMPDESYSPDYMDYCYFSPRYLTEVLTTLYNGGEERFPNIIPCMKKANPDHYFALPEQMRQYEIAQKYGSFVDNSNRNWNGTAGIIYTPNPIILTVMTLDASRYEKVIGDAALMMTDYALKVDGKLEGYRQAQAAKEAAAQAEAEKAAEEQQAAEAAQAEAQAAPQQSPAARAARKLDFRRLALVVGIAAIALALVVIALYISAEKRKKRKRYEEYKRRFEAELRQERERERRRRQEE